MDDKKLELDMLFAAALFRHLSAANRQAVIDLIEFLLSGQ